MNSPVRQHWVPKTYLRGFATRETTDIENPQVWVYDLGSSMEFCSSINNIAVKKHLYTIGANQQEPLYVVEKTLSRIEGYAKPLLNVLARGIFLVEGSEDRKTFAIFLSTLIMRNRRAVNIHHDFRDWLMKDLPEDHDDVAFSIGPVEHRWSKEVVSCFKNLDDEGMHVLFARSIVTTALPLARELENMQWCLIRSEDRLVITSDNPVVVFHPNADHWGIGTPGVHIHLPISPEYILLVGHDLPVGKDETHSVPEEGVMGLNYLTMHQANQFLIGEREFGFMNKLIREYTEESNKANAVDARTSRD